MTHCTQDSFDFPPVKRRRVQANFEGGAITSDAGVLLLRQVDQRLGLSEAVARALNDPRRQASCLHNGATEKGPQKRDRFIFMQQSGKHDSKQYL